MQIPIHFPAFWLFEKLCLGRARVTESCMYSMSHVHHRCTVCMYMDCRCPTVAKKFPLNYGRYCTLHVAMSSLWYTMVYEFTWKQNISLHLQDLPPCTHNFNSLWQPICLLPMCVYIYVCMLCLLASCLSTVVIAGHHRNNKKKN